MADPDLLIVGAGPAGLACAIAAKAQGLEVAVVERSQPPLDKACGEGLMPDGLGALESLGVELPERKPFHGISYHQKGTVAAAGRFPPGVAGAGIRRLELHRALAARAQGVGVPILWGAKAKGLLPGSAGIATEEGELQAKWIVGADGLHSKVREWAGLEGKEARWQRFGVRRHFAIAPWSDLVEVHWGNEVEAYVTPVAENEVGIAFLWSGRKSSFEELLGEFPEIQAKVEKAEPTSKGRGAGPLEQKAKGRRRGNLFLLGDAGGYLDAITGEGLSLAFHQAKALAEAIAQGRPESYEARAKEIERWPLRLTRLVLALERRPWLRQRALRAFAADPQLFERFLAVHCRALPPKALFAPTFAARLVTGILERENARQ